MFILFGSARLDTPRLNAIHHKKNAKPFTMFSAKSASLFLSKSPQLLPRDDQNCNVQNKMQPILLPDKKCKSFSKIVSTAKAVSKRVYC